MRVTEPVEIGRALVMALPHVQHWADKTVVIKAGGAAMTSQDAINAMAQDLVLLRQVGVKVVLVHGGGPAVSAMGKRLGITPEFVDGLRVTDDDTMRVAQMVQIGGISRDILTAIARFGGRGLGLSAVDGGGWLKGQIKTHVSQETGEPVDLGRVGEITEIDTRLLTAAVDGGYIPVIAPVAVDDDLQPLNVNADSVACSVAGALSAPRLLFMTDVDGIHGPDGLATTLSADEVRAWIASGVISGGMVPKAEGCLMALSAGVDRVSIVNGTAPHASLVELLTDGGAGTLVRP